jgi:hypothetical protein
MMRIDPQTDAVLTVTLTDTAGAPVTGATVTATGVYYTPTGTLAASSVNMPHSSGGKYTLAIAKSWSDAAGKPVLGMFVAYVTAVSGPIQRSTRVLWYTDYAD